MKIQEILIRIQELMSIFITQVKGSTAMGMYDINRLAENVLLPLFGEVYGFSHLENLNITGQQNFPGIDLGDKVARVAFQITATADSDKVKDTLQKFVTYNLYDQYDRLIIYILTEKQKTYSGGGYEEIIQGKFSFDKERDILDYRDILGEVGCLLVEKADRVRALLEKNFGKPNVDWLFQDRSAIFISHSKPDGNDFSQWLALKLLGQGYSVWCDLLNLTGGEDPWKEIQEVITEKICVFLYVTTAKSNLDQSSLKELQITYDFMRKQQLEGFIIPLLVENVDQDSLNILLKGFHPISFSDGWAIGLYALIGKLEDLGITKSASINQSTVNLLWKDKFNPSPGVVEQPEEYLSNWFPIQEIPQNLYFHELQRTGGIGSIDIWGLDLPFPSLQHNIYLVSFANTGDFSGYLGSSLSIKQTTELKTIDFLNGNFDQKLANKDLAWNYIVQLLQQAWEMYTNQKHLRAYQMANKKICHFFHKGFTETKVSFKGVNEKITRRNLVGYKTVRKVTGEKEKRYWLFGIEGKVILYPLPAYVIKPHVLFSNDGHQIWTSVSRLHAARRSWCKDWWNDEWRDRISASLAWLSNNSGLLEIPIGSNLSVKVDLRPVSFTSPVSYIEPPKKSKVVEQATEDKIVEEDSEEIEDDFFDIDDLSDEDEQDG